MDALKFLSTKTIDLVKWKAFENNKITATQKLLFKGKISIAETGENVVHQDFLFPLTYLRVMNE